MSETQDQPTFELELVSFDGQLSDHDEELVGEP
jgi:hypothetical protein